jgi:hypothetical protein
MVRSSFQTVVGSISFSCLVFHFAYATAAPGALAAAPGYFIEVQDTPDSASVGSSKIDSHTVRGGHFPPQPLNMPPDVNQGPGRTIPEGPYRPLTSPAGSTTIKSPAGPPQ